MEIINLTLHPINIVSPTGDIKTISQSGTVARVSVKDTNAGTFIDVPLVTSVYGDPEGLPDPKDGVLYVVSVLIRTSCPDRKDLASPSGLVRDPDGNIIGCKALEINA